MDETPFSRVLRRVAGLAGGAAALSLPSIAWASEAAPLLDGRLMGPLWVVPFVGILLSIAVMPLAAPHIWHHHFGKIAAGWGLAFLVPFAVAFGPGLAAAEVLHVALLEYIPFIILLTALFTVAGGVRLKGALVGTPMANTAGLALGTVLASVMGTTGLALAWKKAHAVLGMPEEIGCALSLWAATLFTLPAVQGPHGGFFHLSGRQHRRLADTAG